MFDQVRAVLFDALDWLHLRTKNLTNLGRKFKVARDEDRPLRLMAKLRKCHELGDREQRQGAGD